MNKGFWDKLKKPIMVMAPMADVTDAAFRYIIAKYSKYGGQDIGEYGKFTRPPLGEVGGPDALWTEFVSADGLFLGGKGALMRDLIFTEAERPIVAQFFTSKPEMMERVAALAKELGFDGVDINMGCPDKSIEKQGAGAAMIKNPKLAAEIIRAAKAGAGNLPVSVKTRTGFNKSELDTWLPVLLKEEPAVITVHARTRKEMSKVPARWEEVKRAVEIRNLLKSKTLIFGNGDVKNISDAKKLAKESGADGVMLGRAIFGNPWLFANLSHAKNGSQIKHLPKLLAKADNVTTEEKLSVMVEHTKLFEDILGKKKSFSIMKKHFKAYVSGFLGAKELRMRLMEAVNAGEVSDVVNHYLKEGKILDASEKMA